MSLDMLHWKRASKQKKIKYNMSRVSLWHCSNGNGVALSLCFFFTKGIKSATFVFKKRWPYNKYDRTFSWLSFLFLTFYVIHFRLYCCHHSCFGASASTQPFSSAAKIFSSGDVLFHVFLLLLLFKMNRDACVWCGEKATFIFVVCQNWLKVPLILISV